MGKREHIYEIIAENIRKERRRLGITQAELAERADVSLDTIKSVENGRRAMSLDTYLNIVHNIIMLGEHGITVETANDDMAGYYQKMEQAGKKEDNGIVSLADFMAVFFRRLRANR